MTPTPQPQNSKENFCLSDKAIFPREKSVTQFYPYIYLEDVKEFIKRLKEKVFSHFDSDSVMREFIDDDFKELAGEKLI